VVFDRVLQGDDVDLLRVELAQHCVHGGGFAGTGRADDQDDAARIVVDQIVEFFVILPGKADALHGEHVLALVEKPDGDFFTENRRQGRDPKVHVQLADPHVRAAVLRDAVLRDVEAAHHLDTGDDGILRVLRHGQGFIENAVHAETDHHFLLARFEVNIARVFHDRPLDDRIHQPDGRSGIDILFPDL